MNLFVLSYGEGKNILPVGIYAYQEENDGIVTLCKLNDDLTFNDMEVVILPKRKLEKMLKSDKKDINTEKLEKLYDSNYAQNLFDFVSNIDNYLEDEQFFKDEFKNNSIYDGFFTGEKNTLEELGAAYVANGSIINSQYSLMPYEANDMKRTLKKAKDIPTYDEDIKRYQGIIYLDEDIKKGKGFNK